MARKNKTARHAKPKAVHKPQEQNISENSKAKHAENIPRRKGLQPISSVTTQRSAKKREKYENEAAHVVGFVAGIIGGAFIGSLVLQTIMILYGPILGCLVGAGIAGLSGVAIQNVLSKHIQLLKITLPIFGILILPLLLYLVLGTSSFEFVRDKGEPTDMINLE